MTGRRRGIAAVAAVCLLAALLALPFIALGLAMPGLAAPAPLPAARTLDVHGGSWRYEDAGSGDPVILFLHGFNQDASAWDAVWDRLEGCACRRIRVDLPGFGASGFRTGDFSLARQSQRLGEFLESLGIRRVTLVGVSMGGSLAAQFAAGHPGQVSRLVLLAPSGHEGALTHGGLFGRLVRPGGLNRSAAWLAGTRLYQSLFPRSAARQALTVSASYGKPWDEVLSRIAAPTVVAWARDDRVADPGSAQRVADAIPLASLVWFDGAAGHDLPESRPEGVLELLGAPVAAAQR